MKNQLPRPQTWDMLHAKKSASEEPDAGVLQFAKRMQMYLPAGSRVLDAGCGEGRNLTAFAGSRFRYFGFDCSLLAIRKARFNLDDFYTQCFFQVADLTRLPCSEALFSAAICVHVLPYHHRESLVRCLNELHRVLQPGGWLYCDFLDRQDLEYGSGEQIETDTFLNSDGLPVHFCTVHEIRQLLSDFSVSRIEQVTKASAGGKRVSLAVWAMKKSTTP